MFGMNSSGDSNSHQFWVAAAACMAAAAARTSVTNLSQGFSATNLTNIVVINCALGKSFTASKALLWAYSGYFKAVLDGAMTSFNLATVPGEVFEVLLNGMNCGGNFEGFLTLSNVNQVMFYAHLLQISTAVSQCRSYLINKLYLGGAGILPMPTPTASSPLQNDLMPYLQPQAMMTLSPSNIHPIHPFVSSTKSHKESEDTAEIIKPIPIPNQLQDWLKFNITLPEEESEESETEAGIRQTDKIPSSDGQNFLPNAQKLPKVETQTKAKDPVKTKQVIRGSWYMPMHVNPSTSRRNKHSGLEFRNNSHSSKSENGADIGSDVATCDGPVRFHKVKNYLVRDEEGNFVCELCDTKFPTASSLLRHERSFHAPANQEELEDPGKEKGSSEKQPKVASQSPCSVDCSPTCGKGLRSGSNSSEEFNPYKFTHESKSKPMVLKDVNVHFFPCKTCGARFPSYYFVHKHKKMWHEEELAA